MNTKEQKQRQLEEKMEAERQSNEERMRQMKKKMDEEMRLQREEAERGMDSKLREQAALLEKGFKEKADRTTKEIEDFKRKNKEAEKKSDKLFKKYCPGENEPTGERLQKIQIFHMYHYIIQVSSKPIPAFKVVIRLRTQQTSVTYLASILAKPEKSQ
ncbi:hypothetical protein cypCar_00016985 [Cyprinus carpio]|nr:hypothetical protein cypCar_00016985 [Cyprinus carpio]